LRKTLRWNSTMAATAKGPWLIRALQIPKIQSGFNIPGWSRADIIAARKIIARLNPTTARLWPRGGSREDRDWERVMEWVMEGSGVRLTPDY
jgi:hypothetical protein